MVIGILDLDLLLSTFNYQVSLDVMQIAAYHRKLGDKVKVCRSMKQEDLSWYSQIYVIYNQEKKIYIDYLLNDDRVTLIGKYFYSNYDALPDPIKDTYPDRTIYDSILAMNILPKAKISHTRQILKYSDFIRVHRPSNLKFISENSQTILLYDLDLSIKDYDLIKSFNKKITFRYPLKVRTYKDALKWKSIGVTRSSTDGANFIADNFIEPDLMTLIDLPASERQEFLIQFGDCPDDCRYFELKKMLRFAHKARKYNTTLKMILYPINDKSYAFLYNCIKNWYSTPPKNVVGVFHTYFKKPEDYNIIIKIKAKDPELYKLLNTTLELRKPNE